VAAGTVTAPNTFVNGTTADADQVNANFDAVETAVNDNDARITTVEGVANAAQVRVSGSCAVGSSIRAIAANGTVSCEADDDTDTTLDEAAVDAFVANNNFSIGAHTVDTDTTYSAGSGLSLVGTTFSADTAVAYTNPGTGVQYSNNASYCGSTPATDGAAGGYATGKALCEAGCSSATAHICEAREMVRFAQTGGTVPTTGWITSGGHNDPAGRDCTGFTTNSPTVNAALWTASNLPSAGQCDVLRPFLCCD
jgi:hypothetical protein